MFKKYMLFVFFLYVFTLNVTQVYAGSGNCLDFDGVDDHVRIENKVWAYFVIQAWIKADEPGPPGTFAYEGDGLFWADVWGNNQNDFVLGLLGHHLSFWDGSNGTNVTGTADIADGQWHHIVLVRGMNDTEINLYVDGVLDGYGICGSEVLDANSEIHIGGNTLDGRYFKGKMDEVRIGYHTAFVNESRTGLRENMRLTNVNNSTGRWTFDEFSGTNANDSSGFQSSFLPERTYNHGILVNMDDSDWVVSTAPVGSGVSTTLTISAPGQALFAETGVEMKVSAKTGGEDFVVTRIEGPPNRLPAQSQVPFAGQFWVVDKYGNGTITTDITFTVSETITQGDLSTPGQIKLYHRNNNSHGPWTEIASASQVHTESGQVTFKTIFPSGQFMMGRNDVTAPVITSYSPEDGAPAVLQGTSLSMTFSEAVTTQSGHITIKRSGDHSIIEGIDVTAANITGNGTTTITINPSSYLPDNTDVYLQIDAGAFVDMYGRGFSGIADNSTWNFTVTNEAPTIKALSPAVNGKMALDADIYITFSEAVTKHYGNITIKRVSDNTVVEIIDVNSERVTGNGTTSIIINPVKDLPKLAELYIEIDVTAFKDLAGYGLSGIGDTTTWNFKVKQFVDTGKGLPIATTNGATDWADYDKDGDRDILLTGFVDNNTRISRIYRNEGGGVFTDMAAGLPGVALSSVAWSDYDNDGDPDILLTGALDDVTRISKVFRNEGGGVFTDIMAGLPGVSLGSAAWGDYDMDGDPDIILTGAVDNSTRISTIYRNEGGVFTDIKAGLTGVYYSSTAWGDYDNDGDLDILLTGDNGSANKDSRIYRNNGNDTFTDINAGILGIIGGSAAWGDYDADGDPDILLTGSQGLHSVSRVYRNNGNDTFTDIQAGLYDVGWGDGVWGDYDGDGDLDILQAGFSNTPPHKSTVYRNDGNDVFTNSNAGLTGISFCNTDWVDFDSDGDLDIFLTGTGPGDIIISRFYRNDGNKPDSDNDGVMDSRDAFPFNPNETTDTDGDGIGNHADTDDDNDGTPDTRDALPTDPGNTLDTDGDGIGDNSDPFPTGIVYVNWTATGNNNGSSWEHAYTELQPALSAATYKETVRVAAGVYTPTLATGGRGDRFKAFQLKNGVAVYGGFHGDEPATFDLAKRRLQADETILSGNIGDPASAADNSYHVFYHPAGTFLNQTAVLDGVTIEGGNADGAGDHAFGGGMFNHHSSPTLVRCTFRDNAAQFGGGIHNNDYADPTLTNCVFLNNSADYGGGVHNNHSSPILRNCTISGNMALYGSGMCNNYESFPTMTSSILWGNTTTNEPAGLFNSNSSVTITYSNIQAAGYPSNGDVDPDGNISMDPRFINASSGDIHLKEGSPCINKGDPALSEGIDVDGETRIYQNRSDMGADERINTDNDTIPDYKDPDDDNDGVPDTTDLCPTDPDKSDVNLCGCGIPDTDSDNDGTPDCNEEAGFITTPLSGYTGEDGATATFVVKLNRKPEQDVTIMIHSSDLTEGTIHPESLIFTPWDWNAGNHMITVTGVNDDRLDGSQNYSIILGIAESGDPRYNGLNPADIAMVNHDDEVDTDGDGMSDSWETVHGLNPDDPWDKDADADGDGLTNGEEYTTGTNPTRDDSDNDGLKDKWEVDYNLNPMAADSDNNGIPDGEEDPDNDGVTNIIEAKTGTKPDTADSDGNGIPDGGEDPDNDGLTTLEEIEIGLNPGVNELPDAVITHMDQAVNENEIVTLDGSGSSDPDDGIASFLWSQRIKGDEPSLDITGSDTPVATFTSPQVASGGQAFTFELKITDKAGQTNSALCVINVSYDNKPPTAEAGDPQEVTGRTMVDLNGSASTDNDGTIATFKWQQSKGTPVDLQGSDTATPFFTSPFVVIEETLEFTLVITDNEGLTAMDTVNVHILADASATETNATGNSHRTNLDSCFIITVSQQLYTGLIPGICMFFLLAWVSLKRRNH